jgi:dolichol-phosphate mannosyltransferase
MRRRILYTKRAATHKMCVQLFSFLCIGGCGAMVNVLCFSGMYSLLLEVANSFIAYGIAFVVGTEISIVSNFLLNDHFTFGNLHARAWQARCLRYHATSMGGVLLTFGSSFSLLHLLHVPALPAQAAAIIIATACNFVLHHVFTYGHVAGHTPATAANSGDITL